MNIGITVYRRNPHSIVINTPIVGAPDGTGGSAHALHLRYNRHGNALGAGLDRGCIYIHAALTVAVVIDNGLTCMRMRGYGRHRDINLFSRSFP